MANRLRLTILSVACCQPQTAVHDKRYIELIRQVLAETGLEADIERKAIRLIARVPATVAAPSPSTMSSGAASSMWVASLMILARSFCAAMPIRGFVGR